MVRVVPLVFEVLYIKHLLIPRYIILPVLQVTHCVMFTLMQHNLFQLKGLSYDLFDCVLLLNLNALTFSIMQPCGEHVWV